MARGSMWRGGFQDLDMVLYLGDFCIHDVFAHTIQEMRGSLDITIVSNPAIPLVAGFMPLYGQMYPNHIIVSLAVVVLMQLAERWTRSMRGNRTNVEQSEDGLTARQISRARPALMRYQSRRPVRLEERQVELVDGFLVGIREALGEFLDLEDHLCFQQVHDGQAEACRSALADIVLNFWLYSLICLFLSLDIVFSS